MYKNRIQPNTYFKCSDIFIAIFHVCVIVGRKLMLASVQTNNAQD